MCFDDPAADLQHVPFENRFYYVLCNTNPSHPFLVSIFLDSLFFPSSFEMMANHLLYAQGSSLSRVM